MNADEVLTSIIPSITIDTAMTAAPAIPATRSRTRTVA
jgi:hypothetical protein